MKTHKFTLTLSHQSLEENDNEAQEYQDISVNAVVTDQDYINMKNFNIDLDNHLFKVMFEELYKKYIES